MVLSINPMRRCQPINVTRKQVPTQGFKIRVFYLRHLLLTWAWR